MYLSQSAYLTNTIVIISSIPHHTKSPTNLNQGDCRSQLHYLRLYKHINYTNKHYAIHGNTKNSSPMSARLEFFIIAQS